MTKRLLTVATMAAVTALTLTACGGAQSGTPKTAAAAPAATPAPAPAATPEPMKLTINLKDFSFEPKEITAVKGQRVIVTLKNAGEKNHDLILHGAYDGVKSDRVAPGAEGTFEFVADKAGTFEFFCDLKGHKDRGMVGKLIVNDK